ncbi:MAG: hypothetical protein HFH15_04530 [Ruminococcus sp.]|nr:hypothetical protein [Ruminococcus sp.]
MIFIFGTMLFTVGLNLWLEISEKIKMADETFVTIGTVRQKEQSTMMEGQWDAGLKDYIYQETETYGDLLDPEILESLDIEYISGPQQRPYFGAVSQDILTGGELTEESMTGISLVEIRALEDCVPTEPVSVEVLRVLWGDASLSEKRIDFCAHRTEHPDSLEMGKTYITFIGMNPINAEKHDGFTGLFEYMPLPVYENQTRLWYEVTEDFYETEEGKRWKNIAGRLKLCHEKMVPVTPVCDLQLLRPFHDGDAVLVEGREIAEHEYESGAKVCLIPQEFAKLNGIQVGDRFQLEFYFADYKNPLCQAALTGGGLSAEALDADGNALDAFLVSEYKIIGIYSYPVTVTNSPYALGRNQIFVPENSISENYEDHVSERGPMQAYNTSFRIKNGSAGIFLEEIAKLPESSLLEIEFDDGGYESFASKMRNTRIVAGVLFVVGFALLLATIAFLMYFMILKQKRRTAVERALGMTKRQCILSLLGGIVVLTLVCSIVGATVGMSMNRVVQEAADNGEDSFSSAYTKGILEDSTEKGISLENNENMWGMVCLVVVCETGLVGVLALFFINQNLCIEPIRVLSAKGDE